MTERNYWQRMQRKQMSRRALLRASGRAGVGAAGLALVGCGGDDDDDSVAQATQQQQQQQQAMQQQAQPQQQQQAMQQQDQQVQQQADAAEQQAQQTERQEQSAADDGQQQQAAVSQIVRGGDLRFSSPARTHDYFDPHRAVFGPTQYWMGFYMNNMIRWRNKEQGIMESDITSLPEIPDNETYVFRVDQNAAYWDQYPTEGGRLVTSDDIRINFQRHIDGKDATGAEDGSFLHQDSYAKTSSMETPDDWTFIARTDGPDATWLGIPLGPFGWVTSPEAIQEFGDRWRDEATNVELSSGTGMTIPTRYDPDIGIDLVANPNYWKMGADGQPLPYFDEVTFASLDDPTAIEAAYRGREILIGGFPLSSIQVDAISNDFPDHPRGNLAFGFTIITGLFNFSPDWPGWDGEGNPYLDRRFCQAMHVAVDRYLMIDAVYLGSGKPSGQEDTPWFNSYWSIPEEELLQTPGYRPDREADIAEARALLDASGYDKDRPIQLIGPDIWEQTYQGIFETEQAMYAEALGIEVLFDIQPYTVILQRWIEGTYPGSGPQWTNPPVELDPTTAYNNRFVPGGSWNNLFHDYPPMADLAKEMRVTLDQESRRDMAHTMQRMAFGTHPDHGLDGISPTPAVMNGISPAIWWPFVHRGEDTLQFAHASHRMDDTWIDTTHPDYPA
ncbi:MAG: ABC transporter substrate-binding protein [Chloroflexota bacterium]|nr:ABC transporter substrate-binding protein [Chloroflexota bacterium]